MKTDPTMILTVDLGSTLFKAAVFDGGLTQRGTGTAAVVYAPTAGDRVELPVAETEAAFRAAIGGALETASVNGRDLQAIAITSQAQTFTIRSPAGDARIPFISWRDTRGGANNRAAAVLTDFARHCSVDQCLPLLMVAKLARLQHESEGRMVGAGDLVLMLPTWFVLQLTDTARVDCNLAAMSGLYSLASGSWWDEALRACIVNQRNLPALAELGSMVGRTARPAQRYGLPPGIPLVLAGNDQTAGAYGAGIAAEDAVLITLGTAQVVYVVCDRMPPPTPGVIRGPYPDGRWYQLVADDHGAGTVAWARTALDGCAAEADFDRAAMAAATDCGGVRFHADGPAGRGHWTDATSRTMSAAKARAVLACLAERLAGMLNRLPPPAGDRRLLVAGGGSKSDAWLECLEQRLGHPLQRVETASPARGAARMARGHTRESTRFQDRSIGS